MIIAGELSNLGGLVDLVNDQGSIVVTAPFYAAQVSISAPNGAFALTVIGTAVLGSAPMSDWDNVLLFPGGNPTHDPHVVRSEPERRDRVRGRLPASGIRVGRRPDVRTDR